VGFKIRDLAIVEISTIIIIIEQKFKSLMKKTMKSKSLLFVILLFIFLKIEGQWTGTDPVYTNSSVGIGTTSPDDRCVIDNGRLRLNNENKLAFGNGTGGLHAIFSSSALSAGNLIFYQYNGTGWNTTMVLDGLYNRVGIGTTNPVSALHIGDGYITLNRTSDPAILLKQNGTSFGQIRGDGTILGITEATGVTYHFAVNTNSGNVGIGTTNPQNKLDVNGTIRAKELKATLANWSDYVFNDDYKLASLNEVESFIKENKHLRGIPTTKEVISDGVNVGEMNALLLKKIEELTLYMIEENKVSEKQSNEIELLKKEVELLKGQNK